MTVICAHACAAEGLHRHETTDRYEGLADTKVHLSLVVSRDQMTSLKPTAILPIKHTGE